MNVRSLVKQDRNLLKEKWLQNLDLSQSFLFTFEPKEYLARQGQTLDYLYIIVSGKAVVSKVATSGKELMLYYFESAGLIGDIEFILRDKVACSNVICVSKMHCIGLPIEFYSEGLLNNCLFLETLARDLATKLLYTGVHEATTTLHPVDARLCAHILQSASSDLFLEKLTDVAMFTGTSYRHLLRCIDNLCRIGALEKLVRGYKILNHKELQRRAGELSLNRW